MKLHDACSAEDLEIAYIDNTILVEEDTEIAQNNAHPSSEMLSSQLLELLADAEHRALRGQLLHDIMLELKHPLSTLLLNAERLITMNEVHAEAQSLSYEMLQQLKALSHQVTRIEHAMKG